MGGPHCRLLRSLLTRGHAEPVEALRALSQFKEQAAKESGLEFILSEVEGFQSFYCEPYRHCEEEQRPVPKFSSGSNQKQKGFPRNLSRIFFLRESLTRQYVPLQSQSNSIVHRKFQKGKFTNWKAVL